MRPALSSLYRLAGGLAAACLVLIAFLVILQVGGRFVDAVLTVLGADPFGFLVPSLSEIAGFLLVGASFLALASTLRMGDHIRVAILLQQVPARISWVLEVVSLGITLVLVAAFTWYSAGQAYDSYLYNEVSFGMIPIPLCIPQTVMTVGLGVFAISVLDDLVCVLSGRQASYQQAQRDDLLEGVE